jgi:hypothetical protein
MIRPKYLIADVDDTFTVAGSLHPEVLLAVRRAARAGLELILNTGRPAGYGATLLAYLPDVSAVIVENGGAFFDRKSAADPHEARAQFRIEPADDLRQRLQALSLHVAERAGLRFTPTADNDFRLTDYTVLRRLPKDREAKTVLAELSRLVAEESDGHGSLLASSIHLHFMLDGPLQENRRSKADGAAALLRARGITDPDKELATYAVSVGDSANDASLFSPGKFALSVGVRNIERYLPELGDCRPQHITAAAEGHGLIELIDNLLDEERCRGLPFRPGIG